MDILSSIVFAVAVLVVAGFMIWREVRMRRGWAPARRADHTQADSSTECGGRVVYRHRRLSKWDYIRTP